MEELWKKYAGDFNSMTDEEIEIDIRHAQDIVDEEQGWLDAVASWIKAGKPRDLK